MVIIASYLPGESYGLLGPQIAATIIHDTAAYDCIVIALTRDDNKDCLKKAVVDFIGNRQPLVAFSTLSGREDLFCLAKEFKEDGAFTLLAGPQADVDFIGEKDWRQFPYRFNGLSSHFSCALHGPAEQIVPLLNGLNTGDWQRTPGVLYRRPDGSIAHNTKEPWAAEFFNHVRWDTLYRLEGSSLAPVSVSIAQVLQQIGCPHASREEHIDISYPTALGGKDSGTIRLPVKGCSFCDVATDKGFTMSLDRDSVLSQIRCLPENEVRRKIPFEIINENPLPSLPQLLLAAREQEMRLSQIILTMRADWFLAGENHLRTALRLANDMKVSILLGSMGFESFDDLILANLNKGLTVETNLQAIRLMRQLKQEFPRAWSYSREDGAIHGFIHPTPWDTAETERNNQEIISLHALAFDILPDHSIPLIIHHASRLGDWARELEMHENIRFKRYVSTIGWWDHSA